MERAIIAPIMILPLTKHTESIWKHKFSNIPKITPEIKKIVADMKETLELTSGVGLAAPQVGKNLRLFIINYRSLKEAFINPKLIRYGKETDEQEEGCLSVPGARGLVNRPTQVEIEYLDITGVKKKAALKGYYARIIQHEYDHLSSTFYINRILDKSKIYTYNPIKIVFIGTPKFGAVILKTLYGQQLVGEHTVQLVITAPDKPYGRGGRTLPSKVKQLANSFKLSVLGPATIKGNRELVLKLQSLSPDFLVVASYGKILPREILDIPKKGALNVHPSLLPKYRGPSPIQTAILNGEKSTGVTIMKMNEKMDEGDILSSARMRIANKDTSEVLSGKLAKLGSSLLLRTLHLHFNNKLKPRVQNSKLVTYSKIITKEDGLIDWRNPPAGGPKNLGFMIRAYHPWPGLWTRYNGKVLKLLPEGKVQLEGKEPIDLKQFQNGHKDFTLDW